MDKRLDAYEASFGRGDEGYQALLNEVEEMEQNSEWVNGITSSGISIEAIDGPLFAKDVADKHGLDYELTIDTVEAGTSLYASTGYNFGLVRCTARPSLCETAKLFGSALGRMPPYLFAATINNGLSVAKGSTLMLMRYGKISAFHSDADGGYKVMPISELLNIVTDISASRFGCLDFIRGSNSHGYTSALWELPDARDKLLMAYKKALGRTGSALNLNLMPALRFASSDTAESCATISPVFRLPGSGTPVALVPSSKTRHTRRGGNNPMDAFRTSVADIYARFDESMEVVAKLSSITIYNACNAVVSLCKKHGIAKKYGEAARVLAEQLTAGGRSITAHDLYLIMYEAVSEAIRTDASELTVRTIEESVAKMLKADWSEHDVGGIVAW